MSVVLLSGGLDSSANLAIAVDEGEKPRLALTVDYGQRAAAREISAASRLAEYYGVAHRVVGLQWLGALGGSSLTDRAQTIPDLAPEHLDSLKHATQTAFSVWVPNRNGVLIQVAATHAEAIGASSVIVGFNREEAVTFPDNTSEFLDASTAALSFSTANHVKVRSFTTHMSKIEIVQRLSQLSKPFAWDFVWSCYHGGETPCGQCESCRRLARARSSMLVSGGLR